MNNKTIMYLAGGIAIALVAPTIIKWLKHESAEMKREEALKSFTADESKFMNYVDEGFMGFTASDEFMMLGGGSKPIEFANANGNIPVATDEPNFAYMRGMRGRKG